MKDSIITIYRIEQQMFFLAQKKALMTGIYLVVWNPHINKKTQQKVGLIEHFFYTKLPTHFAPKYKPCIPKLFDLLSRPFPIS